MRTVLLVRESFPDPPALGSALARATLEDVTRGRLPETIRLSRPPRVVAFGSRDRSSPGRGDAVHAAREAGFAPVQRLAGGRAAAFHERTIAMSWAIADPAATAGMRDRFAAFADVVVDALRALGVDARVGAVHGEYCPGEHSVNAGGRTKLMGVGQRVVAGGAHLGGVVVAGGSRLLRSVLIPVYAALGLDWDPGTVGSIEDEVPGARWGDVEEALVRALAARLELEPGSLPNETVERALRLTPEHAIRA